MIAAMSHCKKQIALCIQGPDRAFKEAAEELQTAYTLLCQRMRRSLQACG
jgi:hypothetical protein